MNTFTIGGHQKTCDFCQPYLQPHHRFIYMSVWMHQLPCTSTKLPQIVLLKIHCSTLTIKQNDFFFFFAQQYIVNAKLYLPQFSWDHGIDFCLLSSFTLDLAYESHWSSTNNRTIQRSISLQCCLAFVCANAFINNHSTFAKIYCDFFSNPQ